MNEKPILFQGDMVRAIMEGRKTETRRIVKLQGTGIKDWYHRPDGLWQALHLPKGSGVGIGDPIKCPYGQVGDRLWVRETFKVGAWRDLGSLRIAFDYRASPELVNTPWCYPTSSGDYTNQILKAVLELDKKGIETEGGGVERIYKWEAGKSPLNWKPSIFMPRWASRINLEITEIKVERVQDITEEGALAEGTPGAWIEQSEYPGGMRENPNKCHRFFFRKLWDSINKKRGFGWDLNSWVWVVKFKRST